MYHRLAGVAPAGGLTIEATFADGTVKRYDVKPLLSRWKAFEALRDVPGLFRSVRVDAGGYGVVWNDELDLECEEIWNNGVSVFRLLRPQPRRPSAPALCCGEVTDLFHSRQYCYRFSALRHQ